MDVKFLPDLLKARYEACYPEVQARVFEDVYQESMDEARHRLWLESSAYLISAGSSYLADIEYISIAQRSGGIATPLFESTMCSLARVQEVRVNKEIEVQVERLVSERMGKRFAVLKSRVHREAMKLAKEKLKEEGYL